MRWLMSATCLLAPNRHADPIERCPLLGPKRKTSAGSDISPFDPTETFAINFAVTHMAALFATMC